MRDLTKPMLKPIKAKMMSMTSGPGEAWFYIAPNGLEVCVANEKGQAASNCFLITKSQLINAIKVIRDYDRTQKKVRA